MATSKYTISTLGSHSALQILKGAKDEGFRTLIITLPDREHFYQKFKFIDKIITIPTYKDFPKIEKELLKQNVIMVPHGSMVAYLGLKKNKEMKIPNFGNKNVLDFEADRGKQREWLHQAGINLPRQFENLDRVTYPVIVKSYGAAGGKGYFYAKNREDFENKIHSMGDSNFVIQEYVIGVTMYIHYFYSPITQEVEIMSMDRRYETNVDSLGRIPLKGQEGLNIEPSFVVVGNSPLVLRESLLPEAYAMGEQVIEASKKLIDKKGLYGPFCLETVITPDQKFYVIEISCRIVAGTNLFISGSPYSDLIFKEPMSTGRRIAREIKIAEKEEKLGLVLD